jgi:hypothetical protein
MKKTKKKAATGATVTTLNSDNNPVDQDKAAGANAPVADTPPDGNPPVQPDDAGSDAAAPAAPVTEAPATAEESSAEGHEAPSMEKEIAPEVQDERTVTHMTPTDLTWEPAPNVGTVCDIGGGGSIFIESRDEKLRVLFRQEFAESDRGNWTLPKYARAYCFCATAMFDESHVATSESIITVTLDFPPWLTGEEVLKGSRKCQATLHNMALIGLNEGYF